MATEPPSTPPSTPPPASQPRVSPAPILLSILAVLLTVLVLAYLDWEQLRPPPVALDAELSLQGQWEAEQRRRYEHVIWMMDNQRDVFEWSLRSSRYLFWLSVVVSVSGIAFAFWQFVRAETFDRARAEADEMEIKTQMASLSFKARSMAALVLFVSIAYLMIYAVFVYPIQVLDISDAGGAPAPPPPQSAAQSAPQSAAPPAQFHSRPGLPPPAPPEEGGSD